jgi:high affinity sulfate transporter 1
MPWRAGFQRAWIPRDVVAGIALGVVMVPQGMAYATLAGLPPEVGLYATMGAIVGYAVLGSSRQLVVGPDSSTSTLLAASLISIVGAGAAADALTGTAALIALMAGGLLLVGGLLKAGIIASFISKPVLVGYMNALAVTILVGQAPKILGYDVEADGVIPSAIELVRNIGDTQLLPLAVGTGCLVIIFGLRRVAPRIPGALVAVVIALIVSAALDLADQGLDVVGELPAGLPSIALPTGEFNELGLLLLPAFAVALMGFADTTVTSTVFAERNGYRVDANKDLNGLGTASVFSGLVGGLPVSASDSRTAVANEAGGKSQVTNLVGMVVIGLILMFFSSALAPLPSAALGAVVISAGVGLFDVRTFRELWAQNRQDFWTGVVAFAGALVLGLLPGIVIAVVLSLWNVLMSAARTSLVVLARSEVTNAWQNIQRLPEGRTLPGLVVVRWESALFFGNAQGFTDQVRDLIETSAQPPEWIVLDAEATSYADFTGTSSVRQLIDFLHGRQITFAVAEANGRLTQALQVSGVEAAIGQDLVFPSVDEAAKAYMAAHPQS